MIRVLYCIKSQILHDFNFFGFIINVLVVQKHFKCTLLKSNPNPFQPSSYRSHLASKPKQHSKLYLRLYFDRNAEIDTKVEPCVKNLQLTILLDIGREKTKKLSVYTN